MALVAAGLASAWVLLTLVLGFGSSDARAEDGDDGGALGGLLSSAVDVTTGVVSDAATHGVGSATAVVGTAVQSVTVPAPVAAVAAPLVETASTVVVGASNVVASAAATGLVGPVGDAVTVLVVQTPIVGDVAHAVGVDAAIGSLGHGLDATVEGVATGLGGAGAAIQPPEPVSSAIPGAVLPGAGAVQSIASQLAAGTLETPAETARESGPVPPGWASAAASAVPVASRIVLSAAAAAFLPLGLGAPADAAFAGPGGSGPGAWGLLAFGPLVAYRAWVRRRGPDDERAPAAPPFATDVSPD